MCSAFLGSGLSFLLFTWVIQKPDEGILVAITCFSMGFFVNLCMQGNQHLSAMITLPVTLQVAVEVSFPVPEGISSNIQLMSLQLFGVIFILVMSLLEDPENHSMKLATWLGTGIVIAVSFASLLFKGLSLLEYLSNTYLKVTIRE